MPIDLAEIINQINAMARGVDPETNARRFAALRDAWETLDSHEVNLRAKEARTTFLLAATPRDYRGRAPLPDLPASYAVVASDGSFIAPDRHSPARFYVLNTSTVLLRYGQEPLADINAEAQIYFEEHDLVVPDDPQRTPIAGAVLGFRRAIEELRAASARLRDITEPCVALQDGTLVLWQLQAQSEPVKRWVLDQFLDVMDEFRARNQPLASYISAPGAAELMNVLRIAVCDYPDHGMAINCDDCRRRSGHTPACDILPATTDRYLLGEIAQLEPGERTTVYHSRSHILNDYDRDQTGDHRICFFYLNAGREIARVEVPQWVAADLDLLDLVHAAIFDQCWLGRGYPVALQEAHEAAVLSMADRRTVELAVERALAEVGVVFLHTGKDGSKRGRFV